MPRKVTFAKLIKAGRRVAVCDQISEPQPGARLSIAKSRKLSAPGTVSELDCSKRSAPIISARSMPMASVRFRLRRSQHRRIPSHSIAGSSNRCSTNSRAFRRRNYWSARSKKRRSAKLTRARLRQLRVSARTGNLHLVRTFQGQVAGRLRLRANAGGSRAAGAIVHYLKHQLRRKIDHLTSLRCDAPAIMSCSMPPHKPTSSWSNRAARATRVCCACLIGPSRPWAHANCAPGFCSRCAI